MGVLYTGAVNVPLSVKLEPSELLFRLQHSGSKYVIVSTNQLAKIKEIESELPKLEKIIILDEQENYKTLLILPWDYAFAHTAGIYSFMAYGASIASIQIGETPAETLRNIPENIKEIQPGILLSVPALAKNFRKNIEKGIREKGSGIEKLFNRALKLAYDYNGNGFNRGKGLKKLQNPFYWLYTGDLGYMDNDGFLYVLGRFKSLLIADDGEKYSPERIEEALTDQSQIFDRCMLYNNQNAYTLGLIVPNIEAIKLKPTLFIDT